MGEMAAVRWERTMWGVIGGGEVESKECCGVLRNGAGCGTPERKERDG